MKRRRHDVDRPGPSPPPPNEFHAKVDAFERYCRGPKVREGCGRLRDNYRWVYNYGLTASVGERTGARTGLSDPTLGIVESMAKKRARGQAAEAARLVSEAFEQLKSAVGLLDAAETALVKAWGKPEQKREGGPWPPKVDTPDLEEARAAKRRREARGEGFGES